jgi:4-carboxymuconolactone decarboxylase
MDDQRYARGLERLGQIDGDVGRKVLDSLAGVAPDLARYVIEFPFGDVYSRPGLGLREREIATVAALAALGNAAPQLAVHVHGALNVGVRPAEIVEVVIQMAVYAGFPAALRAAAVVREVFQERGVEPCAGA